VNTYLKSLAHEYISTIAALSSGLYDAATIRDLEQQRGVLHDQLVQAIGRDIPRHKMPQYVKDNLL